MISIQKEKIIEDEKVREEVLAIIAEREAYYTTLFKSAKSKPAITLRFENLSPCRIRITFHPVGEKPMIIDTESFTAPDVAVKHAFKKLRRTAKNYFVKNKSRHRE